MSKGGSWRSSTTSISDRSVRTGSPSVKWLPFSSRTVISSMRANTLPSRMRQPVGRVVEQLVAAPLRLQRQREARVAGDR